MAGVAGLHPLGRLGRAEEVAELVAFLASDGGVQHDGRILRSPTVATPRSGGRQLRGRVGDAAAAGHRELVQVADADGRERDLAAVGQHRVHHVASVHPQAAEGSHATRRPPTSRRTRSPSASTTVRVRSVHATMPTGTR